MSFKRLVVRTKKSFSGIHYSNNDQVPDPLETTCIQFSTIGQTASNDFDEFVLNAAGDTSPVRDSSSRRKRFLGSLRSMTSLRSLRSNHGNVKSSEDSLVNSDGPHTPARQIPPLALNFEISPPGQPMFESYRCSSGSSMYVHRSSPIAVPTLPKTPTVPSTPPTPSSFVVGTVPDSPAPLQRASFQEVILQHSASSILSDPSSIVETTDMLPTPMPGTNLPLEDAAAPEIVVSSLSAPPVRPDASRDYFSIDKGNEDYKCSNDVAAIDELHITDSVDLAAMLAISARGAPNKAVSGFSDDTSTHDSPRQSSENADIGVDLAYIIWNEPAITNDKFQLKHHENTWDHHVDLDDGAGYGSETGSATRQSTADNTEVETDVTEMSITEEADKDLGSVGMPVRHDRQFSTDETLQDIIRGEFRDELCAIERLLDEKNEADIEADEDLSTRAVNRV